MVLYSPSFAGQKFNITHKYTPVANISNAQKASFNISPCKKKLKNINFFLAKNEL
jgi:hypothetical protein